jgi:hypothetical protein
MRLKYVFLSFLILSCGSCLVRKDKSLCEACPNDNSGNYNVETLNKFMRNELNGVLKVDSAFTAQFLKCAKIEISNEIEWFYLSKDKIRNYYHLIGAGNYSTELWVVSTNINNNIEYCFLGAASGGDGGDGFEIYSFLKDSILNQYKIYTSIYIDSVKNDFTDSLRIDSVNVDYLVKGNSLSVIKKDSVSIKSKWENK